MGIFSEKELENVGEKIKTAGKSLYLALPRVFRGNNVLEDKLKRSVLCQFGMEFMHIL